MEKRSYNKSWMQKRRIEKPLENKIVDKRYECKKKDITFNLTVEDLIVPEYCPYLNIPLEMTGSTRDNLISIDRIDPTKGYTKDNIQIISMKANTMKSNATTEELICFAKNILRIHGESSDG